MDSFSIRDLRERVGELTQQLEAGHLAVITKHGQPLAVTVPVDELLLREGSSFALAARMFGEGMLSGGLAAKMCAMNRIDFLHAVGRYGIPAVDYAPGELEAEVKAFENAARR